MDELALYQVVMLGNIDARAEHIETLIDERIADLGLAKSVLRIIPEADFSTINRRLPTIAIFLGYAWCQQADHPVVLSLIKDSNIIITVVTDLNKVGVEIPENLRHINALEAVLPNENFDRITSLVLEGFRLLRRERRLFISYKRDDSQAVANQLYDALDSRGFDVFIDTRTVPPGVDFQAELWHRLADSDVVVLIDTPGFRTSRWTVAELTQANATNVQILHLLWPSQPEDEESALSYFFPLTPTDFDTPVDDPLGKLNGLAVASICDEAEKLRAKAVAARHRYLVDSFCDAARDRGLLPNVQPERWISIDLEDGARLAAVPAVGIPTSHRINEVFDSISLSQRGSAKAWLLYDNRGILSWWLDHLGWLDEFLPVKSISMANADKALKALSS